MPPRTYMVVDPRHDHSFRIPRPDLSLTVGTPNACNNCHADQPADWAANRVRDWYKAQPQGYQRYAETLTAARSSEPGAGRQLAALAGDISSPTIARATALASLGPYLTQARLDQVNKALAADDPMLRLAALQALEAVPLQARIQLAFPVLSDPVRAVRIEGARLLAGLHPGDLTAVQWEQLEQGIAEYIDAQMVMAERPEAQLNLGNLYAARGELSHAVAFYQAATELNPAFTPAYVNHADLRRSMGEEAKVEALLRLALEKVPNSSDIYHALGLSLARQKRNSEALEALEQAASLSPDNARYIYVYAVALNSSGDNDKAILVLQDAHHRFPANTNILSALVAFHRDAGNFAAAGIYAEKLQDLLP